MYIVIELQTNGNTTTNLVNAYDTRAEAEQKYHLILSAAAVSNVEIHAAVMLTAEGMVINSQAYHHEAQ